MNRPRILDLFSGAGGAAVGYHRAGFDVTGVDNRPQPRYPFEFVQGDALEFVAAHGGEFDAIHASPPCQDHTELAFGIGGQRVRAGTGWMLPATIDALSALGLPYVVENVPGADMPGAVLLCARSFGIARLRRHRKFLVSFPVLVPPCACRRGMPVVGVYGDLRRNDRGMGRGRIRAGVDTARELLGCPWMDAAELSQAIPPAYTQFIGEQLAAHLDHHTASRKVAR